MKKKDLISKEKPQNVIDIDSLFDNELGSDNDILKELFYSHDVEVRTDISAEQASIIARLKLMSTHINHPSLYTLLTDYMQLLISKDRKSRKEFVEGIVGSDETRKKASFFGKMFGGTS